MTRKNYELLCTFHIINLHKIHTLIIIKIDELDIVMIITRIILPKIYK